MDRPDEDVFNGHEGEIVASSEPDANGVITFTQDGLLGYLDDGAKYIVVITASDNIKQSETAELDFEVSWDHQAVTPAGTASLVADEESGYTVAHLSPILPLGAEGEGDVCDIYRLSADKPELVYKGAAFGEVYVDPYPTIGENGGYRYVCRTANGDYITEDNTIAWYDIALEYDSLSQIIDFDGDRVELTYNTDLSSTWTKDFQQTKYLGGSVQGDWNAGALRSSSVNGVAVIATDQDVISKMRKLANYTGICQVRTRDGSNYAADVQVTETRGYGPTDLTANFSLTITKVDPETLAGYAYEAQEEP